MTTDDATPTAETQSVGRTIVIAVRSAISAIALIAVFDRQFILSKWLHWALANWKAFFDFVFSFAPFHIPPGNRALLALTLIFVGTVAFDVGIRWRANQQRAYRPQLVSQSMMWVGGILLGLLTITNLSLKAEPFADLGFRLWSTNVPGKMVYATAALLVALFASPRMFLWLTAFIVAFLGANEFALLIEGNVQAPPGG